METNELEPKGAALTDLGPGARRFAEVGRFVGNENDPKVKIRDQSAKRRGLGVGFKRANLGRTSIWPVSFMQENKRRDFAGSDGHNFLRG